MRLIAGLLVDATFSHTYVTRFQNERIYIGSTKNTLTQIQEQGNAEVLILNIDSNSTGNYIDSLKNALQTSLLPISLGGGIYSFDQASLFFHAGVERVVVGRSFFSNPSLISQLVSTYGAQSVAVSLDLYYRNHSFVVKDRANNCFVALDAILENLSSLKCSDLVISFANSNSINSSSVFPLSSMSKIRESFSNQLIYGGGVNSSYDIKCLAKLGIDGVVVSSAMFLHNSYESICVDLTRFT